MLPSDSAPLGLTAPPLPQARVPGMDGDAAAGHVPAVLRPRLHARLHCLHEPGLRLEQEGSWHCAQQLLLGLLPDSDRGRPPGGPVTACPPLALGWRAPGRGPPGEFLWGEAPRGSRSWETCGPGVWGCILVRALGAMGKDRLTGPCALALGLLLRGVWHGVTPQGSSEEGGPRPPTLASPQQDLWSRSSAWPLSSSVTGLLSLPGSGVRRSSCCPPLPGASSRPPPRCSRTWAAPTWSS